MAGPHSIRYSVNNYTHSLSPGGVSLEHAEEGSRLTITNKTPSYNLYSSGSKLEIKSLGKLHKRNLMQ